MADRLLIADAAGVELFEIDPDGADTEGTRLRGLPSTLNNPQGMTNFGGRLLIADNTGDELFEIDPDGADTEGTRLRALPSALTTPVSMTNLGGRLLIADTVGDELFEIDPDGADTEGTRLRALPSTLTGPNSMTNFGGRLLIADNTGDELFEIDPDGADTEGTRLRALPSTLTGPQGMTNFGGRLLIADNNGDELFEIDPDGADTEGTRLRALPSTLIGPQGMTSFFSPAAPSWTDDTGDAISGTVGTAVTPITVPAASGDPTPTYAAVGGLPGGISFNTNTRIISGTPTATGSGTIRIRATNSEGSDDWTVGYSFSAAQPGTVGRLLIADSTGAELFEIDPDGADTEGTRLRGLPSTLTSPQSMTNLGGRLLIADTAGDELFEIEIDPDGADTEGTRLRGLPSTLTSPIGMTNLGGRLLIANGGGVDLFEIDPDGADTEGTRLRGLPSTLNNPQGMTNFGGRLLIADNSGDELFEIDPDGADTEGTRLRALPSTLTAPLSMTNLGGRLLIADTAGAELFEIDPDGADTEGTRLRALPSTLTVPIGMTSFFDSAVPSWTDDIGDAISGTVGTAVTPITVPAASGLPPPTYAVVGSLPGGISFNTNTRIISGTPTAAGSGTIRIRATNSEGTDDWTVGYSFTAPSVAVAAVAPVISLAPVGDIDDNETATLTATAQGGTYDELDYVWTIVSGGGMIVGSGSSVMYSPDGVDVATAVEVSLVVTARGTGTNAIDGTSDDASAVSVNFTVSDAGDITPPMVLSRTFDGVEIEITYNEPLDESSVPPTFEYLALVGGSISTVSSVSISGSVVTLTLAAAIADTATVDLWYFGGEVQDLNGNVAATFNSQSVTYQVSSETHDVGLAFPASANADWALSIALVEATEVYDVGLAFLATANASWNLALAHDEVGETPASIDTTDVTSTPVALADTYGLNEVIEVTNTYDTAVDVDTTGGIPWMRVNFGNTAPNGLDGNERRFDYASGSGTTEIVFAYRVLETDEDSNGIFLFGLDAQGRGNIELNGGTIRNAGTDVDAEIQTQDRGTQGDHHVDGSLVETFDVGLAFSATTNASWSLALNVVENTEVHDVGLTFPASVNADWTLSLSLVEATEIYDVGLAFPATVDAAWLLSLSLVEATEIQDVGLVFPASVDAAWSLSISLLEDVEIYDVGLAFPAMVDAVWSLSINLLEDVGTVKQVIHIDAVDYFIDGIDLKAWFPSPRPILNSAFFPPDDGNREISVLGVINDQGPVVENRGKLYFRLFNGEMPLGGGTDLVPSLVASGSVTLSAGGHTFTQALSTARVDAGGHHYLPFPTWAGMWNALSSENETEPATFCIRDTTPSSLYSDLGLEYAGSIQATWELMLDVVQGARVRDLGMTFSAQASGNLSLSLSLVEVTGVQDVGLAFAATANAVWSPSINFVGAGELRIVGLAFAATADALWNIALDFVEYVAPVVPITPSSGIDREDAWAYPIQWQRGFEELHTFRTEIIRARRGNEQRIAQRVQPRVEYRFDSYLTAADFRSAMGKSSNNIGRLFRFPHPRGFVRTQIEILQGMGQVTLSSIPSWIAPGEFSFLVSAQHNEMVEIDTVVGHTVTFTEGIAGQFPGGSRFMRGAPGRFTGNHSISAVTSRAGAARITLAGDPKLDRREFDPDAAPDLQRTTVGPPTGPTATLRGLAGLTLDWVEPVDTNGNPVIGHHIEYSDDGGATWAVLVQDTRTNATRHRDTCDDTLTGVVAEYDGGLRYFPGTTLGLRDKPERWATPNWRTPPRISFTNPWIDVDFERGVVERLFPQPYDNRVIRYLFTLLMETHFDNLLGLFYRARGRQGTFYFPSYLDEFQSVGSLDSGDTSITVEGRTAYDSYNGNSMYHRIRLQSRRGVQYVGVDSVELLNTGNTRFQLSRPLVASISLGDWEMGSWMNLCRFESDALRVRWVADEKAEVGIDIRTLEAEG